MALVNCPECRGSVSTAATACPKCGYPINDRRPAPPPPAVVRTGGSALGGCATAVLVFGLLVALAAGLIVGLPWIQKQREADHIQRTLPGKWKQADGPLELEFFPDGTLAERRLLDTGRGTYRLLPNRRMELRVSAVIWGQNELTVRYELTDDELTLIPEAGSGVVLRYRKVR